jgi:hypothetical protein
LTLPVRNGVRSTPVGTAQVRDVPFARVTVTLAPSAVAVPLASFASPVTPVEVDGVDAVRAAGAVGGAACWWREPAMPPPASTRADADPPSATAKPTATAVKNRNFGVMTLLSGASRVAVSL